MPNFGVCKVLTPQISICISERYCKEKDAISKAMTEASKAGCSEPIEREVITKAEMLVDAMRVYRVKSGREVSLNLETRNEIISEGEELLFHARN